MLPPPLWPWFMSIDLSLSWLMWKNCMKRFHRWVFWDVWFRGWGFFYSQIPLLLSQKAGRLPLCGSFSRSFCLLAESSVCAGLMVQRRCHHFCLLPRDLPSSLHTPVLSLHVLWHGPAPTKFFCLQCWASTGMKSGNRFEGLLCTWCHDTSCFYTDCCIESLQPRDVSKQIIPILLKMKPFDRMTCLYDPDYHRQSWDLNPCPPWFSCCSNREASERRDLGLGKVW